MNPATGTSFRGGDRRFCLALAYSIRRSTHSAKAPLQPHPVFLNPYQRPNVAPFTAREVDKLQHATKRLPGVHTKEQSITIEHFLHRHQVQAYVGTDGAPLSSPMHYPVLVLNHELQPLTLYPITFVNCVKALRAVLKGRVNVVRYYEAWVKTVGNKFYQVPAVISIRHPVPGQRAVDMGVKPYRRNIFLRDEYSCVYCGQKFAASELTLDHVIPQALGGESSWSNLASACKRCNTIKGDKPPTRLHELDMVLRKAPATPTADELRRKYMNQLPESVRESWKAFLEEHCLGGGKHSHTHSHAHAHTGDCLHPPRAEGREARAEAEGGACAGW